MDAKITKQRLSGMLAYDWLKIIGIVLAVIIGWSLVFSITATRILPTQQITVFSYTCNDKLSPAYYDREDALVNANVFSHEIKEVYTYELAEQKDSAGTMLSTRLSTGEGDLMFAPKEPDLNYGYVVGEEVTYPRTYIESLLTARPLQYFDVEKYLADISAWLDTWYDGGHESGTLNEDEVKKDFITRYTVKKDKRYRTDKQRQAGAVLEVERVKKYKSAYDTVMQALADGNVRLERVQTRNADGSLWCDEAGNPIRDGMYALNICPNEPSNPNTVSKFRDWYRYNPSTDKDKPALSAKNMCAMFIDMQEVDDTCEYESLVYVAYLINDCYYNV